ncbi:MAG: NUDIX hydrolase [Candidatus Uhrbacteria bacterium]
MKHVVVGIISRTNKQDEQEYLLVCSKRDFGEFSGFYYPPGGHIEDEENEKDTLIREIREELDIEIEPIKKVTEAPGDIRDQMTCWWSCRLDTNQELTIDTTEIADADWFTKDQMSEMNIWPATRNFFKEYVF